jgi:glycerol-3-phosphate dehydrogenase subunit C
MREGGLEAPTRHALDWRNPAFYEAEALDDELRRVFDICHTCRRCFNLCDSFPRLFVLFDESDSGELDSVDSLGFKPVIDACTLCDMCYMTKCPYVPPHEFNIDFSNLMLRYRAVEHRVGKTGWAQAQLARTDRNGHADRRLPRPGQAGGDRHRPRRIRPYDGHGARRPRSPGRRFRVAISNQLKAER